MPSSTPTVRLDLDLSVATFRSAAGHERQVERAKMPGRARPSSGEERR
jgi:hypothetical protein